VLLAQLRLGYSQVWSAPRFQRNFALPANASTSFGIFLDLIQTNESAPLGIGSALISDRKQALRVRSCVAMKLKDIQTFTDDRKHLIRLKCNIVSLAASIFPTQSSAEEVAGMVNR
jgi:hypothetical protein